MTTSRIVCYSLNKLLCFVYTKWHCEIDMNALIRTKLAPLLTLTLSLFINGRELINKEGSMKFLSIEKACAKCKRW